MKITNQTLERELKLKFDELNKFDSFDSYKNYFGAMYITPKQMHSRIDLARNIEEIMMFIFISIGLDCNITKLRQDAVEKLTRAVEKAIELDDYINAHIFQIVDEVIDVTEEHSHESVPDSNINININIEDIEDEEDEIDEDIQNYWFSTDRAKLISANEANAFFNYGEYREAKKSGKTKKTWITELDDKVRMTHSLIEGKTVDIDGLFLVGESLMRFPKDTMYDPLAKEVVNCRCACRYE